MGQRHQIYLRLPAQNYGKDNPNTCGEKTVGIHHQWLYGKTALKLLKNYLTFMSVADKDDGKNSFARKYDAMERLAACYSVIPSEGYFHRVHTDLEAECDDPRLGDNNDGITIIDISKDEIKYCFMSICGIEAENYKKCPKFKPLTAEQYVTFYYPEWRSGFARDRDGNRVDAPEHKAEIIELLDFLKNYKTLSLSRVKKIFPKMFSEE